MGKDKIVKVGIAGLGRSGWGIHCRLIGPLTEQYKIVAVYDPDVSRQKEAAVKFGARTYSDYKELVKDKEVELIVVASRSHHHAEHTLLALNAGKDVVCEKPMATSVKAAEKMIREQKKTKRLLTIFQNYRYHCDFVKVREVIQTGKLGRIIMVHMRVQQYLRRWDWQMLKKFGGGYLNNYGAHMVDQALLLFGPKEPKLFCRMEKTITTGDAEDHIKVILYGTGSPTIDIDITNACAYPDRSEWVVMGMCGGLAGNMSSLKWKYFDPKKFPPHPIECKPTQDRSYNREQITWKEENWQIEEDEARQGDQGYYPDLYKTLRQNDPLVVTPESVLRQIKILAKCRKMAKI